MKKILSIFAVFILIFTLAACKPGVDPAEEKLDAAYNGLAVLIGDPNMIVSSFNVPTNLKDGVKATWSSDEPGIASVGAPNAEGTVIITINRPTKGSGHATVTLSAKLVIENAKGKELEKIWSIKLTVLEQSVEAIKLDTIRDILNIRDDAYNPYDKKDKIQVTIKNATVFAVGSDAAFAYDGTGIIQIYGGDAPNLKVGKVYDITGLIQWYFGLWQISDPTAAEVDKAPEFPEQEEITEVENYLDDLIDAGLTEPAFGSAKDGNVEPMYAKVTGKVYVVPGQNDNYDTFIVDSDYDTTQKWTAGGPGAPARGFMLYYLTNNMSTIREYNGLEVTVDVVIYTYRSNNHAFAFYYIGGPDGVELGELSEEDMINLDFNSIDIPGNVLEAATLEFPEEGGQGTEFVWTYTDEEDENNALIDLETGKVTPIASEMNIVKITVTATNGEAELVKEYEIAVGNYDITTIADVIANSEKDDPIRVKGVLLGNSATNTFWIYDGTATFGIYTGIFSDVFADFEIGQVLDITGVYDVYNGVHQISGLKENTFRTVNDELIEFPEMVDVSEYTTEEQLDAFGQLVKVTDLTVTKVDDPSNAVELTLENEDGVTFLLRLDIRTKFGKEMKDDLLAYEVGDVVSFEGLILSAYKVNPQLLFINDVLAEEIELSTIKEVNEGELENDTPIRVRGILLGGSTPSAFWLQDETAGINLYVPSALRPLFAKLTPGVELEITGEYELYNGMHELKNFSIGTVRLINGEAALPEAADVSELAWTAEAFNDHHGSLVKVEGFTMKADGPAEDKSVNITIVSPEGVEFVVRYDNRMPFSEAVFEYLSGLEAGDEIDIDMLVVGWYNGPQLIFVSNPFE